MIRLLDLIISTLGLFVLSPILIIVYLISLFSTGSPLFFQPRVGRWEVPFTIIKFRTMRLGTSSQPSHLANENDITRFGAVLRKTKLDELPQLWNVLKGDMSIVGPRPCLTTQLEVISSRRKNFVFRVRPGITGLAQIEGIDMSTPERLASTDAVMVNKLSVLSYFSFIFQTMIGRGRGDSVSRRNIR
jgi:O-antigen biosynthesis protein WbqP